MRTRKFAAAAAMVGIALIGGSFIPASATQSPEAGHGAGVVTLTPAGRQTGSASAAPGECTGSWVKLELGTDKIAVRSAPDATDDNNIMFRITGNGLMPCRKLVLGVRYGACGHTGANGYILVQDFRTWYRPGELGWSGYIPSVCTTDPS